jgi:REP element-mobilizing transposase RayT
MCIFTDDADYRQFVHLLGDVVEEHDIACWNYCVMPNHYHATLQPADSNISAAIRCLNSRYAQWWNRRHERVGHVFQGRFKDQIVDRESYLLTLSRYVVMNPVRAKLVARPEDWSWSSYRATAGLERAPAFLDVASTLKLFGDGPIETLQSRFTNSVPIASDDPASIDRLRSNERILGSKAFKKLIAEPRLQDSTQMILAPTTFQAANPHQ